MQYATVSVVFLLSLMYVSSSSSSLDEETKSEVGPMPLSQTDSDDPDKRGWNNLSGMWGKRGWNNLSGMWGKRGWNNLSGMWGKRDWNDLSGMWGKRGWNNLSGMWGKRGWNNLSGMWGKRGWNNLSGMWGKRSIDAPAIVDKRNTQWNNLKGVWGKRSDGDWSTTALWEQASPMDDEYQGPVNSERL